MGRVVVVEKVEPKRTHIRLGAAVLQSNVVIRPNIVHQNVQPAKFRKCLVDYRAATFNRQNICAKEPIDCAGVLQLRLQLLSCFGILVHEYRNGALARAASRDGLSNSLAAAGNEDNLVFKPQVHEEPPSNHKTEWHFRRKYFPCAEPRAPPHKSRSVASPADSWPPKGTLANPSRTSSAPARMLRRQHQGTDQYLRASNEANLLR